MWGGGCVAHGVVKMVENNEAFCLPHNLSYEGSYHVRHFYPRLICCRHSPHDPGMASPGADCSQSPASSPQRRPLLAHVEGGAVVSKIAVPPGHPPLTCSSTAGIGLRGMGLGPVGTGSSGRGGAGGRGAGGIGRGVVVQQPAPSTAATGSMFTTPHPHHQHGSTTTTCTTTTTSGSTIAAIQNGESADGNQNVIITTTTTADSLTPSSLEKYLVSTHGGHTYHRVHMGDGHQGGSEEQKDPGGSTEDHGGEEGGASATSPVSPDSVVDNHTRAVFRLSDGSDFSDDYIAMTDANGEQLSNDVINGSSVCSDVFSDRSSEQDDLPSPPLSDVTGHDATSQEADDDDETPKVFPGLSQDGESYTRRTLLIGQGHDLADDNDPSQDTEPAVRSPDITLEEVFDLQRANVNDDGGFYDDKEFEFLKAEPVKRSTSLKTYKTPPGTPKRKMVRFADALGLDLESVRHILNMEAPPRVPMSAMKDLKLEEAGGGAPQTYKAPLTEGARYLTACFPQPGINPTFPLMVRDRKVILESCVIYDHNLSVSGTVRVANLHFHKEVTVRCTTNNWLTFNDINAGYVHNSNDGPTDRFSFTISLPHYFSTGSRLQFCIRYVTDGQDFWDNNHGRNYVIECYARTMPDLDNTWTSFL